MRILALQWLQALANRAREEALNTGRFDDKLWLKAFAFQCAAFGKFDAIKIWMARDSSF